MKTFLSTLLVCTFLFLHNSYCSDNELEQSNNDEQEVVIQPNDDETQENQATKKKDKKDKKAKNGEKDKKGEKKKKDKKKKKSDKSIGKESDTVEKTENEKEESEKEEIKEENNEDNHEESNEESQEKSNEENEEINTENEKQDKENKLWKDLSEEDQADAILEITKEYAKKVEELSVSETLKLKKSTDVQEAITKTADELLKSDIIYQDALVELRKAGDDSIKIFWKDLTDEEKELAITKLYDLYAPIFENNTTDKEDLEKLNTKEQILIRIKEIFEAHKDTDKEANAVMEIAKDAINLEFGLKEAKQISEEEINQSEQNN
ncbi:MAG: hypothetical protein IJ481_04015 [Alphaproteobacteria bacterium]|nr:hypothetical protein [Alphaproteobacteria bacterium]